MLLYIWCGEYISPARCGNSRRSAPGHGAAPGGPDTATQDRGVSGRQDAVWGKPRASGLGNQKGNLVFRGNNDRKGGNRMTSSAKRDLEGRRSHPVSVAITGGGIGGMALALALHDAGFRDVDVYESASSVNHRFERRLPGHHRCESAGAGAGLAAVDRGGDRGLRCAVAAPSGAWRLSSSGHRTDLWTSMR
jgi:hypothetical protein